LNDKVVETKGLLTYGVGRASFQNVILSLNEVDLSGSASVILPTKDKGPVIEIDISSQDSLDLNALSELFAAGKGSTSKKAASSTFLPETISVPQNMTATSNVYLKDLKYNAIQLKDLKASLSWDDEERAFSASFSDIVDNKVTVDATLDSASQSNSSGKLLLSKPKVTANLTVSAKGKDFISKLMPDAKLSDAVTTILQDPYSFDAEGVTIEPKKVSFGNVSANVYETEFFLSGSYSQPTSASGKPLLSIVAKNESLKADRWLAIMSQGAEPAEAKKPFGEVIASISLPFDLDLALTLEKLGLLDEVYDKVLVDGSLKGDTLNVKTFQIANDAGHNISIDGKIGQLTKLSGVDLNFDFKTTDLPEALSLVNYKKDLPVEIENLALVATANGNAEKLSFVTNVDLLDAKIEAKGWLASALSAPSLQDLSFRLRHANYNELVRHLTSSKKGSLGRRQPVDVYFDVSSKGKSYAISNIQSKLGEMSVLGSLTVDVSNKPSIKGDLSFSDLFVDRFLGKEPSVKGQVHAVSRKEKKGAQDIKWSKNALNLSWMHNFDLSLGVKAKSLSYSPWVFQNADSHITVKDGVFSVDKLEGGLLDGRATLAGQVIIPKQERQPLQVISQGTLSNVNLERFVENASSAKLIRAQGNVSVDYDIKTTGLSPAALIYDLDGKGGINGNNFVFEGFDLAKLSKAMGEPTSSFTENFTGMLDATMSGGKTVFDTLEGGYTITKGSLEFKDVIFDGPDASVKNGGIVNLGLLNIDMVSMIKLKEPADAPPLTIDFKGPLNNPKHTFGKKAAQSYFESQIKGILLNPLLEKLDERNVSSPPSPANQNTDQPAGQQPVEQKRDVRPEDILIKGVIDGLLGQ
jgi:hypothetical protein